MDKPKTTTGTKIVMGVHLPASDTHFAEHLMKGPTFNGFGTYQHKKFQLILPLCKRRNVALDIGAHVGLWSQPLAKYFMRVIAFEPVTELAECWRLNTVKFSNVSLHQIALGARADMVSMTYTADNSGNTHVTADTAEGPRSVVQMLPLDEVELGGLDVDFIKIDTEGYEHDILRGGERLIKKCRPVILVEQKPGNAERYGLTRTQAVDLLHSWNYRTVWERSGDFALVPN